MLDRYIEWRRNLGDPVHPDELEYVAARSTDSLAASLRSRTISTTSPISAYARPARGGVISPAQMGYYEAAYWTYRFQQEGDDRRSARYYQRYQMLHEARNSMTSH